jgi:hypothetical protein
MFALKSSWIAIACVLLFLAQDSAGALVGTRTTNSRYNVRQRDNMLGKRDRGAGCGQVKSNAGPPYAGQCVCFDESTRNAIFGQTPEVVQFANNNTYRYPQSVSAGYLGAYI